MIILFQMDDIVQIVEQVLLPFSMTGDTMVHINMYAALARRTGGSDQCVCLKNQEENWWVH